jgi:hypothetical protein
MIQERRSRRMEGGILVVEVWMSHSGMGLWIRLYILIGRAEVVDARQAITRVSE